MFTDLLKEEDIYYVLTNLLNNDCYIQDFWEEPILDMFVELLETYNLVYIASDDRVLLTPSGEKTLQNIARNVDLRKNYNKIKRK